MAVEAGGFFATEFQVSTGLGTGTPLTVSCRTRAYYETGSGSYLTILISQDDSYSHDYYEFYFDPSSAFCDVVAEDVDVDYYSTASNACPAHGGWVDFALVLDADHIATLYARTEDRLFNASVADRITVPDIVVSRAMITMVLDYQQAMSRLRVWNAALTPTELLLEWDASTAVRTADLFSDTPLADPTDVYDVSGNANDWTLTIDGTLDTYAPRFPVSSPVTVSSVPMVDPVATTGQPSTWVRWYQYTATADDPPMLGVLAFADIYSNFRPTLDVFAGEATDPYRVVCVDSPFSLDSRSIALRNAVQRPIAIPLRAGETYYIRVTQVSGGGTPLNADLTVTFQWPPTTAETIPAGSLFITDDNDGFPSVFLDESDGSVIRFVTGLRAADVGAVLPNGYLCLEHGRRMGAPNWVAIYNPALELVAAPDGAPAGDEDLYANAANNFIAQISHNGDRAFFVADYDPFGTDVWISRVTITGVVERNKWVLPYAVAPQLIGFAPAWDETVLYHYGWFSAVKRWDLIGDTAIGDFIAAPGAGYANSKDMIVLSDGSLILGRRPWASWTSPSTIYHYDPDGTLLHTYGPYSNTSLNRMCAANDDPVSFWAWFSEAPSDSASPPLARFVQIDVATGATLQEFTTYPFQSGQGHPWDPLWPDGDPPAFQHSFSCALLVFRTGYEPEPEPEPPPSPPSPIVYQMRRLRRSQHLTQDGLRAFYHRFQLDLDGGVGLVDGQGEDPQLMLRWSDDGGHTWSHEHWVSAGRQGRYGWRALWRRLGYSRDRVFEVVISDPVKVAWIQAWVEATGGQS